MGRYSRNVINKIIIVIIIIESNYGDDVDYGMSQGLRPL